ncbi:hypothetical protein [Arthrobacter sp. S2(2024)]|uniref:hypothetical protein n=1 Tax=Arthrobacter sp. S2(2024) TaxID=3111911 RepID=UPI002FCA2482
MRSSSLPVVRAVVPRSGYAQWPAAAYNETVGILICGTNSDRSVRYSIGCSTSTMAVVAYT